MNISTGTDFLAVDIGGTHAAKFLQNQLTMDINKVSATFCPSAICNLKGRVQFGLWICTRLDGYRLVLCADMMDAFLLHIKKYGAFFKLVVGAPFAAYGTFNPNLDFISTPDPDFFVNAIRQGIYWLDGTRADKFGPQELRLHQMNGVHYDKGCYLGQEVVARLYFKAKPKSFLQRVQLSFDETQNHADKIICAVKNNHGFDALVVARPHELGTPLDLPEYLMGDVGRV